MRYILIAVLIAGTLGMQSVPIQQDVLTVAVVTDANPTPNPNCSPNVVPVGQADPPGNPMPMAPIWCFTLGPEPTTVTSGTNDWEDDFATNVQMGRLNDGDMGYRVFPRLHNDASANQTQHFINNNHWHTDLAGGNNNGASLRPARSFTFENGVFVVEADVAAGITDYGGGTVWPEITVSMADQPTGQIVDPLYVYGAFGGFWTVGCRIHPAGNPICSVESSATNLPNNQASCNMESPSRVMEISDFEICGTTHFGGNRGGTNGQYWRQCQHNQIEAYCFDRFRMELTKSSLTMYVNGHLYFQDAGWDAAHQLPDSMVNGGPVYAYFSDWRATPRSPAYRFFWERVAVNPHNPDGTLAAPSASDYFCLGQPLNTCADELPATPTATVLSTSTALPPTATATISPTPTQIADVCEVMVLVNGKPKAVTRPVIFCTNQ